MILVILGIFIAIFIGLFIVYDSDSLDYDLKEAIVGFIIFDVIALVATLVITIVLAFNVSKLNVIDEKIAMYEEENAQIESELEVIVERYMEYESGVFADISPDSSITYVTLYPELKSDILVRTQMQTHIDNANAIKDLKRQKIDGSVLRWWLYLGG